MLNLVAIYTRSDADASAAVCELAALRSWVGGHARCFHFGKCFHLCFHFGHPLSHGISTVSKDVSNVSIFSEEFYKKNNNYS
jgi:hypothetical protein